VKRRILLFTLCALVSMLSGVKRPPGLDDVSDHRHWSYPDYTRVVVELSGPVKIKDAPRLLAPTNEKGARLYLDVEGVWVGTKYKEGIEVADGLLERFRIGQNTRTDIRVVLDLQTYARHRILTLTHPDRLVIDVYSIPATAAATRARSATAGCTRRMSPCGWRKASVRNSRQRDSGW
jgi:hypothetical protein